MHISRSFWKPIQGVQPNNRKFRTTENVTQIPSVAKTEVLDLAQMASELVPGDFPLIEVNASFRWFSQGSQTTLWNLRRITHSLKKKKKKKH